MLIEGGEKETSETLFFCAAVLKVSRMKKLDKCIVFVLLFSRRVPGKRRRRSKHVKAAMRASISPSANTTASPAER